MVPSSVLAQERIIVDASEVQKHLVTHVDPVYPAIARAANVSGAVVLQITIGKDGKIANVTTISGPLMLVPAAKEAVNDWQYTPFEKDGAPITAISTVMVVFDLSATLHPPRRHVDREDEKIADAYYSLFVECKQLVDQQKNPAKQVKACQKAAEQADRFSPNSRYVERRTVYVYYTTALIRNGQAAEAVAAGEKAIAVVLQGHDDDSGATDAYAVAGQAKVLKGDLTAADKDFEIAEEYQRKALNTPAGHVYNQRYSQTLKSLFTFHAQVLAGLGKQAEAAKKTEEASKL